jgi:four helix bundle protein
MQLVERVYQFTESFPQREVFGLTNQMRRAAVSIPSNIAEGQGRATTKDFLNFLSVARGSLQELETQALLAHRLGYLDDVAKSNLVDEATEVARIIHGLMSSLQANH